MHHISIRLAVVVILVALALGLSFGMGAQADPLPPPHLGYGVIVRLNVDMADGLGFEWIKLYEADYLFPSPLNFPPEASRYNILYRVKAEGWPASIENYVAHVEQLVRDGKTKGVKAYEIGNEPNIKPMWGEQYVSPEQYARLLCRVYPAIKGIDPNAIVVSAGIAPVGRQSSIFWHIVMDDRVFVQRMFDTMRTEFPNQWPCFDVFGYHPQGYPYPPEISYSELQQQHPDDNGNAFHFREAEYYHNLMVGYGIGDREIWATEFGYLRDPVTNPWDFSDPPWSDYGWCNDSRYAPGFADNFSWMKVSEAQQADYLVRAYQYADANMPWMGVIFLYNIDWNNQGWSCDHVKFFSIYKAATGKADTDPRSRLKAQAFYALAAMPKRSAYAGSPALSIQPASITFLAELSASGVQTRTVQLDNLVSDTPMTWTVQADPASALQPIVTPPGGIDNATLKVQLDSAPFGLGTYSGSITVTAEPTSTIGSPATIGVNLIVVSEVHRVFLPVVGKNYTAPPTPPPGNAPATRFGLDFVSSAEDPAAEARYGHAAALKATINRWPMYWPNIEKDPVNQPRVFDWSAQDANVVADINHGLDIDAILMLTPPQFAGAQFVPGSDATSLPRVGEGWRILQDEGFGSGAASATCAPGTTGPAANPPPGLYLPVFADNSDAPGAGKTINPNNRWAIFVNAAVNRYRPGGTLGQQRGWGADTGIRYWEIWNEEDLCFFFNGTPADYARVLKVAYLAAKHADPGAQIIFGGMAHFEKSTWLNDVLNEIATYPDRDSAQWFMDAVASHNYTWSWQTFYYLYQDRLRLDARGLNNVRLWLTETGVPVCDDPPYVFCPATYRATMSEQVDYLIQSFTYAIWMNTESVMWFQLYDDAGNDCQFDAFGLVRNPPTGPCTPRDGTPRPAYNAYKTATQYLSGLTPYWRLRPTPGQELIALQNAKMGDRVISMWARNYVSETVTITATATSALLVYPDGTSQTILPVNGYYTLTLPAATNTSIATTDGSAPIGGSPRILIEHDPAIVVTP